MTDNLTPPNIQVNAGSGPNSSSFQAKVYTACWITDENSCDVERDSLKEIQDRLLGMSPLRAEPEQVIDFSLSMSEYFDNENLFDHNGYQITRMGTDEEHEPEVRGKRFNVPEEPGRHFYSLSITWDNEIKGEAKCAFSVLVYDDEED
ncbi:hypothetical protein [Lentibacillus sediminis]|uniref:hypothetical protein n=1 Tax=Lentibacillus sediminis TaxID=1940529 RepID=UPI000C1C1DD5|nr:hypothetical protein [Lentibacillus sediminis]